MATLLPPMDAPPPPPRERASNRPPVAVDRPRAHAPSQRTAPDEAPALPPAFAHRPGSPPEVLHTEPPVRGASSSAPQGAQPGVRATGEWMLLGVGTGFVLTVLVAGLLVSTTLG